MNIDLNGRLAWVAEQVEAVLEQAGRRGMSPAHAARQVRRTRRVRCTATEARLALAYLTGNQYAHTLRNRPERHFSGKPY